MEFVLVFVALILASVIGWLFRQSLNTRPWVADPAEESTYRAPFDAGPKIIGLLTFMAVATSFFALIISAYAMRMDLGDWIPLSEPNLLWVNTGFLLLASVVFQWTRNAALRGEVDKLRPGMVLAGILTAVFVGGQFVAWQLLSASGHYMTSNPSAAFFFLLTGAHALHILGGMYVWGRTTIRLFSGKGNIRRSIELCAIYWHFLLLVWVVLFAMMLRT